MPTDAQEFEVRAAAEEAVRPVGQAVEKRQLDKRLIEWAAWKLPWGSDDRDRARLRRECTAILAELPPEVSEAEAKEALQPTVTVAWQEIESRQGQKERQAKKARLVEQGVGEVSSYMLELERKGEITSQEYWDGDVAGQLRATVRQGLEAALTGDESTTEVRKQVHRIIDAQID